jgi:hypothetical protein
MINLNIPKTLPWALPAMRLDLFHRVTATLPDPPDHSAAFSTPDTPEHPSPNTEGDYSDDDDLDDPLISLLSLARQRYHSRQLAPSASRHEPSMPNSDILDADEASILEKWKSSDIDRIVLRQVSYSSRGIHDCKRDVGPGLDAVQAGVVKEYRVALLFDA